MPRRGRGRTRKHSWIEHLNIDKDYSTQAQFLRWASVNNSALAQCANLGCPRCAGKAFRLRHDKKFENIRFYCPDCHFETSFHIIRPRRSFGAIDVYNEEGMMIGQKNVDDYHPKTVRENADAKVLALEQRLDLGGEWFDGFSGTNSQSRYQTREEVLERIRDRKMKMLMKATLDEIENEETDDRIAALEVEREEQKGAD
jgi:hypothetical protein